MNNYNWYLNNDLSSYAGKWIAIFNEKVIASSKNLEELTKQISNNFSLNKISFVKIPDKQEALIYKC